MLDLRRPAASAIRHRRPARWRAVALRLVAAPAAAQVPDRGGRTPLQPARSRGHDAMARVLERAGAR